MTATTILFKRLTQPQTQPQTPCAVTPSHTLVSCPPGAVETDSGTVETVKTVKATAKLDRVIRFKLLYRRKNLNLVTHQIYRRIDSLDSPAVIFDSFWRGS